MNECEIFNVRLKDSLHSNKTAQISPLKISKFTEYFF